MSNIQPDNGSVSRDRLTAIAREAHAFWMGEDDRKPYESFDNGWYGKERWIEMIAVALREAGLFPEALKQQSGTFVNLGGKTVRIK